MHELSNKKLVVVLGMHRSGTSAITRSLKTLGVDLGESLVPPVAGDNDKGFWEDVDTLAINQDLMAALGVSWCPLSPYEWERVPASQLSFLRQQARELLEAKLKDVDAFGIKDPRLTRLLPFWMPVFSELGADMRYLLVIRNPLSVSDSLHRRNGFSIFRSQLLWLRHVVPSVLETHGKPRIVVSYERMMADPKGQLIRMALNLQLPFDETSDEFVAYAQDFLSPELQRAQHTFGDVGAASKGHLGDIIKKVYAALDGMAADRISDGDPDARSLFVEAERYLANMEDTLAYIDELEKRNEEVERAGPPGIASRLAELEAAYDIMAKGKAWLESQRDAWQALAAEREERITELSAAIEQYRQGNEWLDSQRRAWREQAASSDAHALELSLAIERYKEGNDWLESQRQAWEQQAMARDARIAELSLAIERYKEGIEWLESQRQAWEQQATASGVRITELMHQLAERTRTQNHERE